MKKRTLFTLLLWAGIFGAPGFCLTTDPVQTRAYRFVSISAEDAQGEIDRVLSSLGGHEGARQADPRTLMVTDRVTRLMQIDEIISLLDKPLTQTLPARRRMHAAGGDDRPLDPQHPGHHAGPRRLSG